MPLLMSIDGIKNSSELSGYEGWLLLTGFNWGGTRGTTRQVGRDGRMMTSVVAPQLRAVKVTRTSDYVTPQIWNLLLSTTKKKVDFVWLRTGGGSPIPYMKLRLDNALITSMAEMSTSGAPEETICLTYERITFTIANIGDSLSGPQDIAGYDLPKAAQS